MVSKVRDRMSPGATTTSTGGPHLGRADGVGVSGAFGADALPGDEPNGAGLEDSHTALPDLPG